MTSHNAVLGAMYSASVVESVITLYSLKLYTIGHPVYLIT